MDGGTNWRDLNVSFGDQSVNALAVNPQGREQVYAGTDDGLFVSSDGGESWRRYDGGDLLARGIWDLAIDPSGRTLYIGGRPGLPSHVSVTETSLPGQIEVKELGHFAR